MRNNRDLRPRKAQRDHRPGALRPEPLAERRRKSEDHGLSGPGPRSG